jgi:hypothetical protein
VKGGEKVRRMERGEKRNMVLDPHIIRSAVVAADGRKHMI